MNQMTKLNKETSDYDIGFNIGLKDTLSEALALDHIDYETHFEYEKKDKLFWYFRSDRRGTPGETVAIRIEQMYPDEVAAGVDDKRWGIRSGEIAAIKWLMEEDRECADDWFPFLDS